jgi:hypothetical protein
MRSPPRSMELIADVKPEDSKGLLVEERVEVVADRFRCRRQAQAAVGLPILIRAVVPSGRRA